MKSGERFALAAIWESWNVPGTEEWMRTFAIITTTANEPVAVVPFPSKPMCMWPISTRANKPENNDPEILEAMEIDPALL
jgi:putative SOS response-associated peptidase YedK